MTVSSLRSWLHGAENCVFFTHCISLPKPAPDTQQVFQKDFLCQRVTAAKAGPELGPSESRAPALTTASLQPGLSTAQSLHSCLKEWVPLRSPSVFFIIFTWVVTRATRPFPSVTLGFELKELSSDCGPQWGWLLTGTLWVWGAAFNSSLMEGRWQGYPDILYTHMSQPPASHFTHGETEGQWEREELAEHHGDVVQVSRFPSSSGSLTLSADCVSTFPPNGSAGREQSW